MSRPRFAALSSQSNFSVLYIILVAITKYVHPTSLGVTSPSIHEKFKNCGALQPVRKSFGRNFSGWLRYLLSKFLGGGSCRLGPSSDWRGCLLAGIMNLPQNGMAIPPMSIICLQLLGLAVEARWMREKLNRRWIALRSSTLQLQLRKNMLGCWWGAFSNYCLSHCLPENEVQGHLSRCVSNQRAVDVAIITRTTG